MLQDVVVRARARSFGDRYLGYLDSIARFEGNTDYVGACGWLNCPACGSGKKPVEGITYSELIEPKRSQVNSHPFAFSSADMRKVTYSYPEYSEEELLKNFKLVITQDFYEHKEFSEPNYDRDDKTVADTRNTLFWNPVIITDVTINNYHLLNSYYHLLTTRFSSFIAALLSHHQKKMICKSYFFSLS